MQSFLNWVGKLKEQVSYLVFKNLKDGEILPDNGDTQEAIAFRSKAHQYSCASKSIGYIFRPSRV